MGDMKQPVRHLACQILLSVIRSQTLSVTVDNLGKAFQHRNFRVRESLLLAIKLHVQQQGLSDHSPAEVEIQLVPKLVAALNDGQASVRSAAVDALTAIYGCVGEELSNMLTRHDIRPGQMKELAARFEKAGGPAGLNDSESEQCDTDSSLVCCSAVLLRT
jgi:hypothetical protein